MILSHDDIVEQFAAGKWHYYHRGIQSDWQDLRIGPNSIDLTLHPTVYEIEPLAGVPVRLRQAGSYLARQLQPDEDGGLALTPGRLYVAAVNEAFEGDQALIEGKLYGVVPQYEGRSTTARVGISTHLSAGFGDRGFSGAITLETTVVLPTVLYPGERVGQLYFTLSPYRELGGNNRYTGAYSTLAHRDGPVLAVLGPDRA